MGERARPTAEEVITKLKDDGGFDTLRLKIIRKLKDNEELRSSIVSEVKQSAILNADGSENLKPRQLSDAIYQELGKKIMGQISDELWKVIRSNDDIKNDIRGGIESVYNRMVNPEVTKKDRSPSPRENSINGKAHNVSPVKASAREANMTDENETDEPPGFCPSDRRQACEGNEVEQKEVPGLPSEELHHPADRLEPDDALPPGFGPGSGGGNGSDDDPDVPPGFG